MNTTTDLNWAEATPRQLDFASVAARRDRAAAERDLLMSLYRICRNDRSTTCRYEYVEVYVSASYRQKAYTVRSFLDLDRADSVEQSLRGLIVNGIYMSPDNRDKQGRLDVIAAIGTNDLRQIATNVAVENETVMEIVERLTTAEKIIDAVEHLFKMRGGWSRFYLVTSSQGHIHSSMGCSTCNKGRNATTFALVCDLSDSEVEEAVDLFGAALCSICYPEAPVEMTDQVKITKARAEAYAEGGIDAYRALVAKSTKSNPTNAY